MYIFSNIGSKFIKTTMMTFTSIRYLISSNRKWQQDDLTSNTSKCKIARLITVLTS